MRKSRNNILLISMPFAGTAIPSIQLPLLEGYLKERDVEITTKHLYLKSAEFYGLNNYNFLIYSPNESYTAQMVFSKYVFPEHWKKNEDKFREYFQDMSKDFDFDTYVRLTDNFYDWVIEKVNWRDYDIIGFTLNYGQFLPSLAIAKKIKELSSEKIIIFGGSRNIDEIGINVLKTFSYVDFICSGDGEEPLFQLASNYNNYKNIPNLIYRDQDRVVRNESEYYADLNELPFLSFDSFYEELASSSDEIKQYFNSYGRLPVEISRGCWWNKCSFCSQRVQHKRYQEKDINRLIEEIKLLSDKYKLLDFQIIGDTLPKNDYKTLLKEIILLGRDFTFFVEARAGRLQSEDYKLLSKAGFDIIQTGIETFSQNYIKKMNKGSRVIDNIATLKFCKENHINNRYNLIINYPNEEIIDFEETRKNIRLIKQYLEPPQISYLIVEYGSYIYNNPQEFNIEKLEYTNIDKIMFPEEVLERGISCIYRFKRKNDLGFNDWEKLIGDWKTKYDALEIEGLKRKTVIDKHIFFFVDGEEFVKIYDKRNGENVQIYVLDKIERDVFLSCIDVVSFEELQKRFPLMSESDLKTILNSFEEYGIVFREDNYYLSLPLCYSQKILQINEQKEDSISAI